MRDEFGTYAGFAACAAEAHRRRTHDARSAGAAVAAALSIAVLMSPFFGSRATDSLQPAGDVTTVVESATPSPSPSVRTPLVPRVAAPPPQPVAVPTAGRPAGPIRAVSPVRPTVTPSPEEPRFPRSSPIRRLEDVEWQTCDDVAHGCATVRTERAKDGWRFTLTYCSNVPGEAEFDFDIEADFSVVDADGVTWWRSVYDHPPQSLPHTLTLAPRRCVAWTMTWHRATNDGVRMPAGSYTLNARVLSDQLASAPVQPAALVLG